MNIRDYYMDTSKSFSYPNLSQSPGLSYGYDWRRIYPAQMETQSLGRLQVNCVTREGFRPVPNATVRIAYTADPTSTAEEVTTNDLGRTEEIELATPPVEYSLDPAVTEQPYSQYTVNVTAPGFQSIEVDGAQLLGGVTALQQVEMQPAPESTQEAQVFVIPPHTLFGDFPPKIAEAEIKPTAETGEIVLASVVVPEFVIVHDGPPTDTSAANYYVRYRDYIKNVASSEIYATWPDETITANVLAIMSFTLNRVFTEWYRNQGFNFTITSSTAFDHKWMRGRNIFTNIGLAVDQIFNNFLSRPNVRQPILTQYCDGRNVTCPGWMTV
ncbi:carboxypeptidase regulatory-like domain-containing protein [Anaerocolumna sedimenticola]|uniref:Carboxypeptidase regulatory-like domain-containing protein n=1 Tax=Anaerocolumna sedimenticola TaxID=2696063 RepID=A0A6P1TU73_9FIRM|nr:carboxypeptidase regulatory-like domain-containing protein [Anaerocolumna sedimenticola]